MALQLKAGEVVLVCRTCGIKRVVRLRGLEPRRVKKVRCPRCRVRGTMAPE